MRLAMQGDSQIENVTKSVAEALSGVKLAAGIVTVFIKHTTASVMLIEDEPGIRADTKAFWDRAVPADPAWQHNTRNAGEDNGHSHLRGQLQGPSVTIPFQNSVLLLGIWQQIVVVDFDTRARTRELIIQIMGE
ncbi:MAG: secondary thiamine-phosphate synthase enzyme YjbQ [Nitrospira sp.]|nr:secondary thiamine-phosphate synthase enzyme YjbQ [Nitrospira sp.]MBP0124155.1 secondary thiamine-phosphate synthase enzyme YjbQ [Nitrospira sp.]MBP0126795.1 secondary thiamine-phosphate synthase enzyme YjbQ [Nitrospira sp.]MBP0128548.1 secondary thiamine-phosphate synthase enzyme YjbQ [Nitrospira sp.]MBP0131165.1 secondary thiamine-phosphate synthase enzyme YjbQ [Nitrospira sp.]